MTTQELQKKVQALLGDNEEMAVYRENRVKDKDKRHMPDYHFVSPGGYLNDPNGYCFYKGVWHLFYQFGSGYHGASGWGHAVSVDNIHWIDLPAAIMPTMEMECGSGGTWVEDNRVLACYQGTLRDKEGGAIHIMESTDDLLLNWRRVAPQPVICTMDENGNKNPYNAFDPYMWKEGDTYYLLSAGGGSLPHPIEKIDYRRWYLFSSKDLVRWDYLHPFLEDDRFCSLGDDGACPYFLPLGEKHLLLHFSHMSGGHYVIGEYDCEKHQMKAEQGGAFNNHSWIAGGVHAPSACINETGGVSTIFNVNFGYPRGSLNQIMSLPRELKLNEDMQLQEAPGGDYASLRYNHVGENQVQIPANEEVLLDKVKGDSLEIEMSINSLPKTEGYLFVPDNVLPMFEVRVLRAPDASEYTSVRFYRNRGKLNWKKYQEVSHWGNGTNSVVEVDTSFSTLSAEVAIHPTESQELYVGHEDAIQLHIFVDKSVVEVFAGNQRCVTVRTYPMREDSVGVSVLSRGVPCEITYDAWNMKSIY